MSKSSGLYDWQKQRLLPKRYPGASLVNGYGPEGLHSLYLPSPQTGREFVFVDGKPRMVESKSCLDLPSIRQLRNRVINGLVTYNPLSILFADSALLEYSAALLATQYQFSDDELTMLHAGKAWQKPLLVHAMGGSDVTEALASMNPHWVDMVRFSAEQQATKIARMIEPIPSFTSEELLMAIIENCNQADFELEND
jgi:hypothetical protein